MLLPALHLVTDRRFVHDLGQAVTLALRNLPPGAAAVHLREKDLGGRELLALAREVGARCRAAGQLFLVNDRLDVALATPAAGVQLGRGGLTPEDARRLEPEWWIGVSVHDLEEARTAQAAGADYLLAGTVFPTASHPDRTPLGVSGLADIAALGLPVVAIGGITPVRVAAVRAAGAYGVAAIRGLWDALEPDAAARQMLEGLTA